MNKINRRMGYNVCKWGDTVDVAVTIPADLSYTGKVRKAVKSIDRCIAPLV